MSDEAKDWDQRAQYVYATGPVLLTITETKRGPCEPAFRWTAKVTAMEREFGARRDAVRTAKGTAGHLDDAKLWAARAALLQWMLLALETGIQPPSFPEDKEWLYELRNSLDYERWIWGVSSPSPK